MSTDRYTPGEVEMHVEQVNSLSNKKYKLESNSFTLDKWWGPETYYRYRLTYDNTLTNILVFNVQLNDGFLRTDEFVHRLKAIIEFLKADKVTG